MLRGLRRVPVAALAQSQSVELTVVSGGQDAWIHIVTFAEPRTNGREPAGRTSVT